MGKYYKDYAGKHWGMITVIKRKGSTEDKPYMATWICRCDCGNEIVLTSCQIRGCYPQSCGCKKYKRKNKTLSESYTKDEEMIGRKYGNLVVVKRATKEEIGENKQGRYWVCQCECGNIVIVNTHNLVSGKRISCPSCSRKRTTEAVTTHGYCQKERLYTIWTNMNDRCTNVNSPKYHLYGGRGICVCDEWRDYLNFRIWALNNGYKDTLSIDRIDPDGNYEPKNCRWVTQKEQCNNKRTNHYITYNGVTKTMKEWSEITGINYYTIRSRVNILGWPAGRALGYE